MPQDAASDTLCLQLASPPLALAVLQRAQAAAEGRPFTAAYMPSAASAPPGLSASDTSLAAAAVASGVPPPTLSDSPLLPRQQLRASLEAQASMDAQQAQHLRTAPAALAGTGPGPVERSASAPVPAPAGGSGGEQQPPRTPLAHTRCGLGDLVRSAVLTL